MSACAGSAVEAAGSRLSERAWSEVSAQLGRIAAALHALPLPWQGRDTVAVWRGRTSHAHLAAKHQAAASLGCTPQPDGAIENATEPLWEPFLEYLSARRRRAPLELAGSHSLPQRLLQELGEYLPTDPSALIGFSQQGSLQRQDTTADSKEDPAAPASGNSCSRDCRGAREQPPAWLHGDLNGQNVLVLEPEGQAAAQGGQAAADAAASALKVQLIDFGDAGHGDPLHDLVLLLVDALR
jgi:aminoglycoside phosphotransferase (APT) family kinase protein